MQMNKLFHVLIVTSIATGLFATVAVLLSGGEGDFPPATPAGPPEVDADTLSPEERAALLNELDAQL